ncbi:MAG: hypothetical protein ABIR50_03730 [Ginsengibacter sp.]
MNKIFTAAILLIIAMASIFSTCKKGGLGCANTVYNFQIFENVTPDKDSIHIKDTIFLKVNAPNQLSDLESGSKIDYSNASNLGNVVTLLRFLPANTVQGGMNNFKLILLKGTEVNAVDPLSQKDFLFAEENGYYKFNLAIIPKDTGKYVLTIGNAANVFRRNDPCSKAGFSINFEATDQHFYLLNLWRPDLILDDQGKTKVYYFKVY